MVMVILDTNVISELMRTKPDTNVLKWIAQQNPKNLCITSITLGEVVRGIDRLPEETRRIDLTKRFLAATAQTFAERIYSYDEAAALCFGKLCAKREAAGLHIDVVDIMIAAIAKPLNAKIATRNIRDFKSIDIPLINPWTAPLVVK